MFTLVVREIATHCAGSVMRTPASDPNNAAMLCRAEQGDYTYQTASCTVSLTVWLTIKTMNFLHSYLYITDVCYVVTNVELKLQNFYLHCNLTLSPLTKLNRFYTSTTILP